MEIKKIMCCCGQGLGSSLIIRMNVEKTLKKLRHPSRRYMLEPYTEDIIYVKERRK